MSSIGKISAQSHVMSAVREAVERIDGAFVRILAATLALPWYALPMEPSIGEPCGPRGSGRLRAADGPDGMNGDTGACVEWAFAARMGEGVRRNVGQGDSVATAIVRLWRAALLGSALILEWSEEVTLLADMCACGLHIEHE